MKYHLEQSAHYPFIKLAIYSICLILLFIQCTPKKVDGTYTKPNYPISINKKFQKIDNGFIFGPGTLQLIDTLLIIECKTNINNKRIHVFNKNSGKHITSFGETGQGPGELSETLTRVAVDAKSGKVYICDLGKNKLVTFNLEKIINNKNNFYEETQLYPEIKNNIAFFSLTNNSFITAYSASDGNFYRFVKGNLNDTITTYNQFVKLTEPEEYENVEKSYFEYMSAHAVSPDGTKLASSTRSGFILETFDISGNGIRPMGTKRFYKPEYLASNRDSNYPYIKKGETAIEGSMSLKATNKYIYNQLNETSDPKIRNIIAVFDWKGNPVKKYILDCNILSVVIDEKTNKAYILSFDDEDLNFGYFEL